MTTKPPPAVISADAGSMDSIAYASVAGIPVSEPHERDRLGYNVWRWLVFRKDPLELAIRSAGARIGISEQEAVQRIREALKKQGIEVTE
jgi:hypothetical protein